MKARLKRQVVEEALLRANRSLGDLADALQVSPGALSEWLAGKKFPKPENRRALLTELGMKFDQVFEVVDNGGSDK